MGYPEKCWQVLFEYKQRVGIAPKTIIKHILQAATRFMCSEKQPMFQGGLDQNYTLFKALDVVRWH